MEFWCQCFDDDYGYFCKVVKIYKTQSASNAIRLNGEHLLGESNNGVKCFEMTDHPLDVFPSNLASRLQDKFPNLKKLWIDRCGLKKISKTDLIGLENLEILNLSRNSLTSLPDDLFVNMKKLRIVCFNNNKLVRLSSKLLKKIGNSLEKAFFRGNTKIDDHYDKDAPHKSLKRLMDIMDSLEPPSPEANLQYDPKRNSDRTLEHHKQAFASFAKFKASGEFTDFTIKVRGSEFKVHKNVLAAHSTVFQQTFANDDGTTEKTFSKVKNFSEESFSSFLDFFYSGRVSDDFNAFEVFELAMVFEVGILKAICTDKISATLSEANALEVFNLAHHHASDQLKGQAFKVIQKMIPELPDKMVNNVDQVNKVVMVRRKYDAVIESTKKL